MLQTRRSNDPRAGYRDQPIHRKPGEAHSLRGEAREASPFDLRPSSFTRLSGFIFRHSSLRALLLLSCLLCVPATACHEDTAPVTAGYDVLQGPPKSLRETFELLRAEHARKAYLAMRPYIDPDSRDAVLDLLLAVDALLASNTAALAAVEKAAPEMPRQLLDIAPVITANLELFSRKVRITGEDEDRAAGVGTIRIVIEDTPPPVEVHFRLREGHWVYSPGASGGGGMVRALDDLAGALGLVARSIKVAGRMTPEQVAAEYRLFVTPRLNKLAQALSG